LTILASITGEYIARAVLKLPDAADAPDEPHYADVWYAGRHFRLTFRRFRYTRRKTTRWFWTCEEATLLPPRGAPDVTPKALTPLEVLRLVAFLRVG